LTIILGIDPGSRITGFGVVRVSRHRAVFLSAGSIRLGDGPLDDRLVQLYETLSGVIREWAPTEAAIERVFMNRNADSALKLGHARGVAILAARQAGLLVHEYSATQVKQTVVGRGHAEKGQVQHMVKVLLGINHAPATDAADALAIAICHSHMREGLARLAVAGARA
jgi:crossover junction endodeoxyribonuclease RuvC